MSGIRLPVLAALLAVPLGATGAEPDGAAVFQRQCSHCHGPGDEGPGTLQLGRTRGADKALLTERTDLAGAYIGVVVRQGLKAMPAFAPADVTDAELQALIAYLAQ